MFWCQNYTIKATTNWLLVHDFLSFSKQIVKLMFHLQSKGCFKGQIDRRLHFQFFICTLLRFLFSKLANRSFFGWNWKTTKCLYLVKWRLNIEFGLTWNNFHKTFEIFLQVSCFCSLRNSNFVRLKKSILQETQNRLQLSLF